MPPKAKFSKQEIIDAALSIIETDGAQALTARSLGDKLGSSARPIFTVFNTMDEVLQETTALANSLYSSYVKKGLNEENAFRGVGRAYIRFAKEHPKLFQLLFMQEQQQVPNLNNVLGLIDTNYKRILQSITDTYGIVEPYAHYYYNHMWIYSHGIAVLIATNVCSFSSEEIAKMLADVANGLLTKISMENKK